MDPTTAYQLAQIRIDEMHAEAAARRQALEAKGKTRRIQTAGPARGPRALGGLGVIVTAVQSLPARLRDIPRVAAPERDVPAR